MTLTTLLLVTLSMLVVSALPSWRLQGRRDMLFARHLRDRALRCRYLDTLDAHGLTMTPVRSLNPPFAPT